MEDLIQQFRALISHEAIPDSKINEPDILRTYTEILDQWVNDYSSYREFSSHVLYTLEAYSTTSLKYSHIVHNDLYSKFIALPLERIFDSSQITVEITQEAIDNYCKILKAQRGPVRISDLEINTEGLSENDIKGIISGIVKGTEYRSIQNFHWTDEDIEATVSDLPYLKVLCLKINEIELFYHTVNIFVDRLSSSENYQLARDICEEVLLASTKDNLIEYGFFICFRVYSNQKSIHAALLYANLCLKAIVKKGSIFSDLLRYEVISQTLKLYRNCSLPKMGIEMYEKIPDLIPLKPIEKDMLASIYFHCKLITYDNSTTSSLFDYLNNERENIVKLGPNVCTTWLNILYNIKRLNQIFNFDNSGLEQYISLFEGIVNHETVGPEKDILFGDSTTLKGLLKESLLKLSRTRYQADFGYDNDRALTIATRLVDESFHERDIEGMLLSMIIKSDFSINFIPKIVPEVAELKFPEVTEDQFYNNYTHPSEILKDFPLLPTDSVFWIIGSEEKLYQLAYSDTTFDLHEFKDWSRKEFNLWCQNELSNIRLETTTREKRGGIRSLVTEDFEDESNNIIKKLPFSPLINTEGVKRILLVKDMGVTELPHNLLINEGRQFVALSASITNILSLEWLNSKIKDSGPVVSSGKSIYIPTEGDLTIKILYNKIESALKDHSVSIVNNLQDSQPLSSTINIVSSHGDRDISLTHLLSPDGINVITDPDRVIGKGKILILLVCYSGSSSTFSFKNEVASLAKKYLADGYEAVIAPFWALNIDIPPIWLPTFLKLIEQGTEVSDAVFQSNKAVYDIFPTPGAWACMHLYGNPFFKIEVTQ